MNDQLVRRMQRSVLFTLRCFSVSLVLVTALNLQDAAAEVEASETNLKISGLISAKDEPAVRRAIGVVKRLLDGQISVVLESDGGDVQAAMRIGRMLRDAEARIETCRCLSACVLILAAGTQRIPWAGCNAKVGVHRLYAAHTPIDMKTTEIREGRRRLLAEIRLYLDEMGVNSSLVDLMETVPPESMHLLTRSELRKYGLEGEDAAWNEKRVSVAASNLGVSSARYRQLRLEADTTCRDAERAKLQAIALGSNWETVSNLQHVERVCRTAIMLGIPAAKVERRLGIADLECTGLEGSVGVACYRRVLGR